MHLLILGGSGRTGKLIIESALASNHIITTLIRNTSSMPASPNHTIIKGTPTSASDISNAIVSSPRKPDAVIIALASLRVSDSPFSASVSAPTFMTDVHKLVLEQMQIHNIQRLITISAFGVGSSNANVFMPMRLVLNHSPMKIGFADHLAVENLVREIATKGEERKGAGGSGEWELRWTLVRPCMLSDGEERDVRVLGEEGAGAGCMPGVSRKSVAAWVVRELERGEWIGRTPVLAN